jgi:large subunit ribosomal protein L4
VHDELYLAARNLAGVWVSDVNGLNPVSLVRSDKVLITTAALGRIEEWLA